MKILNFLIIAVMFFNTSCTNDDNNVPPSPIEQLPPATQTGEMTFGCLVNDELFIPDAIGNSRIKAFYQFVDGDYTLSISARNREKDYRTISVVAKDVEDFAEGTYNLIEENSGNFFGRYMIEGGLDLYTTTTSDDPGTLNITKFDKVNGIISGTFEFTILDNDGNTIKITNGRFDLLYTN